MYDYFLSEVDTLNGKILVFSDSHGYSNYMNKALEMHDDADMMIHLGDGAYDLSHLFPEHPQLPLIFIAGNGEEGGWIRVDRKHEPLKFGFTEFAGKKIFMAHGHRYDVKYGLSRLIAAGYEKGADIILYGHTHIPFNQYIPAGTYLDYIGETDRPLLVFNPGSIGMGPDYSFGVLGFSGGEVLASHGKF